MKTTNKKRALILLSAAMVLVACQKGLVSNEMATSASDAIAVAASPASAASPSSSAGDSVYVMHNCGPRGKRDSIAENALPSSVSSYLSANYSGFTFHKAFSVKDANTNITGYVVIIYFNNNPVGLLFDNTGSFVKVLEQREKSDLRGNGYHKGGRFEHRDGKHRDTIALNALPALITAYFASNHASDTLVRAFKSRNNSITVVSQNNGAFVTVFDSLNSVVKRVALTSKQGRCESIERLALPTPALSYLGDTYPNYVFKKAFAIKAGGTTAGYVVLIEANSTKYAVEFDAGGVFVKAKTIH